MFSWPCFIPLDCTGTGSAVAASPVLIDEVAATVGCGVVPPKPNAGSGHPAHIL